MVVWGTAILGYRVEGEGVSTAQAISCVVHSCSAEPASVHSLGVIAGGLVGLIFAVCLVAFMLYRMKKKDEGSYSLEEPKQANGGAYQKPTKQEEFYA